MQHFDHNFMVTQAEREICQCRRRNRLAHELHLLLAPVSAPATSIRVLARIACQTSASLLERIAEEENCHPDLLEKLSSSRLAAVRAAVAENINTPLHVVYALSHDHNDGVRYAVAENMHAPAETLALLTEDTNPRVAQRAQLSLARLAALHAVDESTVTYLPQRYQARLAG